MKIFLLIVMLGFSVGAREVFEAQRLIHAKSGNPSLVFMDNEALEFRLENNPEGWEYTVSVKNHYNEPIFSANARGSFFSLPALPSGYYRVSLKSQAIDINGERGFAVLKRRRDSRIKDCRPSPYSVDLAAYDAFKYKDDRIGGIKILADICDKLGIGFVRNRLIWSAVERKNGRIPAAFYGYREVASIMKKYGMESTVTFHDAPVWTKSDFSKVLPSDLFAVYNFCQWISSAIPEVSVWEFWNEQDSLKAWEFAAAHKAAYLGFKDGNPNAKVTPGSFVLVPFTNEAENMFRNDIGEYCDIFNYHLYISLRSYQATNKSIRSLLEQFDIAEKPIWITECGTLADGDSELKTSPLSNVPAQSNRQEMLWAEFVPKSHILTQSFGVERTFTFILRRKQEGSRQWGLLHPDFSVKPAAVAFAVLNYELGDALFEGELKAPKGFRAFLYRQPDQTQSVAIWQESLLDTSSDKFLPKEKMGEPMRKEIIMDTSGRLFLSVSERLPVANLFDVENISISNAFGSTIPFVNRGCYFTFGVENYVCYINGLKGLKIPPAETFVVSRLESQIEDKSIVLQVEPQETPGKLKLTVCNFDKKVKSGFIKVISGEIDGLPDQMELPEMGKVSFEAQVKRGASRIIEIIAMFEGKCSSKLVIPYSELGSFEEEDIPQLLSEKIWAKNSSGNMTISFSVAEKTLYFRTIFPPNIDRWVYPVFDPVELGINLKDAYGISFEILKEKSASGMDSSITHLCWIDDKRYRINAIPGQWTSCRVLFPDNPERIRKISIGMNPRHDDLTYRLRNFKILR